MFDITLLKEIQVIRETERQKITLQESFDGKKYIKKEIEGDKRELYKTLEKINHVGIPRIYYVALGDKTVVVEEYVDGEKLSELMKRGIKLKKKDVRNIAIKLCDIMIKLHEKNIIHRDIKPDNILIDKNKQVWLIDYDIAKIYRNRVKQDTEKMGTFGYAPLEQYGMMPTDFKTDIYSFGVTMAEILKYVKVKGALCRIAEKCKRLDPSQRYASVKKIKEKLKKDKYKGFVYSGIIVAIVLLICLGLRGIVYKEINSLMRFYDYETSDTLSEYSTYENFITVSVFNEEGLRNRIHILDDESLTGTVMLGKNQSTPVKGEFSLKNGVLTVELSDKFGHSFKEKFVKGDDYYEVVYPDNRMTNVEITCLDMDGDSVEELLVGLADCSFNVVDKAIYPYFNASWARAIKYDEARGFTLCEGVMFSENHKFVVSKNSVIVYLPMASVIRDGRVGYELKNGKIQPYYEQ